MPTLRRLACAWLLSATVAKEAEAALRGNRRLNEIDLVPADEALELAAAEDRQREAAEAAVKAEAELAAKKASAKKKKAALAAQEAEDAAAAEKAKAEEAAAAEKADAAKAEAPVDVKTSADAPAVDVKPSADASSVSLQVTRSAAEVSDESEAAVKLAALAKEAESLVAQLRTALEAESALLVTLNEKLALIRASGGFDVAGAAGAAVSTGAAGAVVAGAATVVSGAAAVAAEGRSLEAVTWNMAAINNNPFEYWVTYDGAGAAAYEALMDGVSNFIAEPLEKDVLVSTIFTDAMFEQLASKMIYAGLEGVADVTKVWKDDFSKRQIVSGILKDPKLGAKRLMSMPDRVTNTIALLDGSVATRPTVVNCYKGGDLSSLEAWWAKWLTFMFDSPLATPRSEKPTAPALMLTKITNAKYPAVTVEDEAMSIPLSALSLAIFDAVLVHVMNAVDASKSWQALRSEMCGALNEKKNERTAVILETTYSTADIVFIQESSRAFAAFAKSRQLGSLYDFAELPAADSQRDQNSLILLKKGGWSDVRDVSASVMETIAQRAAESGKKAPVAAGDVAAFFATRLADGKKYLLASFHGDTDGLATAPVLSAVDAFHTAEAPGAALLFGLDANVHAVATQGRANVAEFAALFTSFKMTSCYGSSPDPSKYTTFNARTYLQPQLNKAVKASEKLTSPLVDRNPKDFILFYEKDFSVVAAAKDNTGTGAFVEGTVFPTLQFPSDHAVTKATLAEVGAWETAAVAPVLPAAAAAVGNAAPISADAAVGDAPVAA